MLKVKICGITNADDARWAASLGADYVGLNFCPESPRKISIDKGAEITAMLPPFIKPVGIFVNPTIEELKKIIKKVALKALQFHGNETAEDLQKYKSEFGLPLWKAIRVENADSLGKISEYAGTAETILLDTFKEGLVGGTGETFDWDMALKSKEFGIPVFLAGGLNPDNVALAVKKVVPAGVDTASGVEKEGHPRKKDMEKMKAFILAARSR